MSAREKIPAKQKATHYWHYNADAGAWDPRARLSLVRAPVKSSVNEGVGQTIKTP